MAAALRAAFDEIETSFLQLDYGGGGGGGAGVRGGVSGSGSTACVAMVGETGEVVVGNVGDSRAVLCRGGRAVRLTTDHKPELPEEKRRVELAGGVVRPLQMPWAGWNVDVGPMRVFTADGQGGLAMSRALGDARLKLAPHVRRALVSAAPDVRVRLLAGDDTFMVLASDGLWDVVTDQAACYIVAEQLGLRAGLRKATEDDTAAVPEPVGPYASCP